MRETLFRGKRVDNGEWVYGFYGHKPNGNEVEEHFIMEWCFNTASDSIYTYFQDVPVIPETVGQYTGLDDKNGVKIFEGDIVREHVNDYTPIYQNGIYMAYNVDKINDPYVSTQFNIIWRNGCEVIGSIHDNQEFMEERP